MSAEIIYNPTFPHGTATGFNQGCHGTHCPAPVACRDVHRRYNGDWSFRRQVDAGITPDTIVTVENEHARVVAEAEAAARRPRPRKKPHPDKRPAANRARAAASKVVPRVKLKALLDQGFTDREIAGKLGFERRQITGARNQERWPVNPDRKRRQGVQAVAA